MLYNISDNFPEDLNFDKERPLISLYQPTHRSFPDNKQDPIAFKNLLKEIEKSLEKLPDFDSIDSIMKPFYEIEEDIEFWNHTLDGLAIFADINKCIVYLIDNPVKELAVVAETFHIKPLLKAYQTTENYHLLGLSRENFYLYKGNINGFEEIEIAKDTPRTLHEVLGFGSTDPHLSHGDPQAEIDKDTEKYFRYVDSFVLDHYSNPSKLPLILVSLKEHQSEFESVSNNPYLHEEAIDQSIDSMELKEIKNQAGEIIERINKEKIKEIKESYQRAEADDLASCDLEEIAKAVFQSRVKTLFVEEVRIVPGKMNYKTGEIAYGDINNPSYDDLLDDLAQLALTYDSEVLVLDKEEMPSSTGIAAIYRY